MNIQEELNEFLGRVQEFSVGICPKWLTPNSHFAGIKPGHNLDLLEIGFDFRVDRTSLLLAETPDILQDPSKAQLKIMRKQE